jgi:DNA-binding NtrC family response regulator
MDTDPNTSDLPLILLASDEPRLASRLQLALRQQRFAVELAPGYSEIESLAQAHETAVVLLEVSRYQSVEAAVATALRIKRSNTTRFVGYLADGLLHNSGLAGDGIFPRNAQDLTEALRDHFRQIG